jgi:ferredoxin
MGTAPQQAAGSVAVRVHCAAAGIDLVVPSGTPILEAVRAAGLPVADPCPDAGCGACETRILEGEPDHRDAVLTAEERTLGETMMICVSGARGDRLVLDL